MADDSYTFVTALGYDTINIFSFSLGGMVAQALVIKHPRLVRKLILTGTGPVPSVLSQDLHRRIKRSELIIYPDSGHGGIFQHHDKFVSVVLEFLAR